MKPLKQKKLKSSKSKTAERIKVPKHVAIIMDGNGRWATKRGLPRSAGHKKGAEAVRKATEAAIENKVRYLTLFAFSAENWNRPKAEVNLLMSLLEKYLDQEKEKLMKEKIRLRVIGSRKGLSDSIVRKIEDVVDKTKDNTRLDLVIAINYGGRQEIVEAAKRAMKEAEKGFLKAEDMTEKMFEDYLYTSDLPPVDLLVRTSGEERVSNFLLWQIAYAEFVFMKKHWPDFKKTDMTALIKTFSERNRRFGGLKETGGSKKKS